MVENAELTELFDRLSRSSFRRGFRLEGPEFDYLRRKGLKAILEHAADFIGQRLAQAEPPNDGKQTPYRSHPVFVAQHATATCCRGCLEKWHGIARGRPLSTAEKDYILKVLEHWLAAQASNAYAAASSQLELDFGEPDSP